MRKILYLVIMLAFGFSGGVEAQTAFQCFNFEPGGGTPAGWTVPAPGGFNNGWLINNAYSGSTPTPNQFAPITNAPQSFYLHVNNSLLGDDNAVFLAGGGGTNATTGSINTTGKTGVSIEFWCLIADATTEIQYSLNGSAFTTCRTVTNLATWTKITISAASVSNVFDNVADLKIRFKFNDNGSSDPAFSVDEICFLEQAAANTLTTGTVSGAPFCPNGTFNLPFTSTGTFNVGNSYTVQLSDATGSFAAPTTIGTLASTANSGNIPCTIPGGTPAGTNYRVRVVSSNPALTAADNGVNFTINSTINPTVNITANPGTTICTGQSVTFTANPTGLGTVVPTYQWLVNGSAVSGATNATFTPATISNSDQVQVQMSFTGPCNNGVVNSNTLTITISGSVTPSVSITANPGSQICPGQSVTFTATPVNGGSNPSYQWQLNGASVGTNSATFTSSTLNNGDIVSVVLTSNLSCVSSPTAISNAINISTGLQVSCSTSGTVLGSPSTIDVSVVGGTAPYTYQITNFGDNTSDTQNAVNATNTTFNHTYATAGNYTVQVQVSDATGCSGTSTCSINITSVVTTLPIANFTVTPITGCDPLVVNFTNTTVNGTTYTWDFGDGNSSTLDNPSHTYTGFVGGVTIRLIATNANGSDTMIKINEVQIFPQPIANASVTSPVCLGQAVVFNNQSVNAISWAWNMGDGSAINTSANPSHVYSAAGTYNVTLDVTGFGGCVTSTAFAVTVVDTPSAAFNTPVLVSQCRGAEYSFTDASLNASTYVWDFGDGYTSTNANPVHMYTNSGNFNVTLYAFHANGCVSVSSQMLNVTIGSAPVSSFTVDSTLLKLPNAFITPINTSSGADFYTWISGDGDTVTIAATDPTPVILYQQTGTYQLELIASRADGCSDTSFVTIIVDINENLHIPNIFTPNGDGINDEFFITQSGFNSYTINIYDRWGILVKKLATGDKWDGQYNGKGAPEGVYVIVFNGIRDPNRLNANKTQPELDFVGTVTLIR